MPKWDLAMFHFLTIANLNISKGIFVLFDACALITQQRRDFLLHLVGAATAELSAEGCQQEIEKRGLQNLIAYHGRQYRNDKEERFREAQAFVHPTLDDCFPLVLLEAMQHRLPIIATPVGAIPDLVSDGDNGLLVPENDPQALANAMLQFIANPELAQKMGRQGNTRYLQSYTRQAFESNLLSILKSFQH